LSLLTPPSRLFETETIGFLHKDRDYLSAWRASHLYKRIPKESQTRMKHSISLALVLASGFALTAAALTTAAQAPATAAATAPAGPSKIAVIAFQEAVAQTNEGQRNFAELKKKYEPRETQLKATNDEIEGLKKELQDKGATLSEADRASRAKVIDEKGKKLQRAADNLREEGTKEMQEMLNALAAKVYDVLAAYAQQQGYTVVLDVSDRQTPVLFAGQQANISEAIVEAYNVKSGVSAPPQAATPRPAAAHPAAPASAKPPVTH
jgi:outer membrane protein